MDYFPCANTVTMNNAPTGKSSLISRELLFGDNRPRAWRRRQHQPRSGHNPAKPARLLPTNGAAPIFAPTIAINTASTDSRLTTNPPTTNVHRPTNPELQSRWCAPPLLFREAILIRSGVNSAELEMEIEDCGRNADGFFFSLRRLSPPPPSRQQNSGPSPRPT